MTKEEGTLVKEETKMEKMFVSGLAVDDNVARISLIGIEDSPGKAFKIFSLLAKNDIMVDIILQSLAKNNTIDISFTVTKDEAQETVKILNENKERINFNSISYDDDIAKLSIVGAGMATNPGVASVMFEALYDVGVNIHLISTSEIKITVLIDKDDANKAANSVHDKFFSQFLLSK